MNRHSPARIERPFRARSRHPVLHFRESVWTHSASLKYLAPKFLLYSEKSTELFGRSTDDRSERFCLEFRANLRVRKDLIHHTVELLNYGDRSSGWRHDSEPRSVFESSKVNAAFAERRNVWKFGDTLATGDCEGAEFPDCTCGADALRPKKIMGTWPAMRSASAGPAPR